MKVIYVTARPVKFPCLRLNLTQTDYICEDYHTSAKGVHGRGLWKL